MWLDISNGCHAPLLDARNCTAREDEDTLDLFTHSKASSSHFYSYLSYLSESPLAGFSERD